MPIPKEVIDYLLNDEDFLSLPDDVQDSYLDRIEAKFGTVQNHENILHRATQKLLEPIQPGISEVATGIGSRDPWQILRGVGGVTNPLSQYQGLMGAKNELIEPMLQAQLKTPEIFPGSNVAQNWIMKNVLTDPLGYAGAIGGTKLSVGAVKGVGKLGSKSFRYLGDVFKSPRLIKNLESEVASHESFIKGALSSLSEEAKQAVLYGKKTIQEVAQGNSKIYKDIMNEIDKGLKNKITSREYVENVIKPSLDEASAQGLPLGPSSSKLMEFMSKYSPVEKSAVPKTDFLGMPVKQLPVKTKNLSLNELKNIKNEVYESLRTASQSGTQQHIARDVTADIFSKYHNRFLSNRVPEFSSLQAEYGPQIEAQRFGYNVFQPSESAVEKGVNVLTRAAKSKAGLSKVRFDEESMLSQLEKGTPRFKGTGSLRGSTEDIAGSISKSKQLVESIKPRLDYAKQLRGVRDDIIKWGITGALGGTSYALARGMGNVLAHSTD